MLGIALSLCSYPCLPPGTSPYSLLSSSFINPVCLPHRRDPSLNSHKPHLALPVPLVVFHECISWTTLQAPHWGEHLCFHFCSNFRWPRVLIDPHTVCQRETARFWIAIYLSKVCLLFAIEGLALRNYFIKLHSGVWNFKRQMGIGGVSQVVFP